ncbi:MAG TPA: hypothetical protein VMU80_08610 [Bryobacteraceae bacterium]|nr:hypothetical protein [Bryobacteraceae bacterium]
MKMFLARALLLALPIAAMAQVATLQIKVLEGEGAVHPAGAHVARPLTVGVTDDQGNPVAGAAVSFQLPANGPGGLFSNGLRTDLVITDSGGRAAVHGLQLNRTGGQFRIRITAVKEQARAGIISVQYIGESKAGPVVNAANQVSRTSPAEQAEPPAQKPEAPQPRTASSGEITPTTTKMSSGSHRKWYVLAAVAVAGGVAFLAISRASAAHSSTVSSSTVSIGTPGITIGNP